MGSWQKLAFRKAMILTSSHQVKSRLNKALSAHREGSPMYSHRLPALYLLVNHYSFLWVDVLGLQQFPGFIGSNGQN